MTGNSPVREETVRTQDVQAYTEVSVYEPDMESQQLDLVYSQANSAIIAGFVLSLLVAAGLWAVADSSLMTLWVAAQAIQTIVRLGIVHRYHRVTDEHRQHPKWMMLFFGGTLAAGVVWGCLGLLFSFAWPVEYQTLVLLSLAGIVSGAISSYAPVMSIYIAFMVPCILIPAQSMLVYTSSLQANLGLILMLFAGVLTVIARNYNQNVVRTLQLGRENEVLVNTMQSANSSLEAEIHEREHAQKALLAEQKLFTRGPVVVFRWSLSDGWPIAHVSETVSQFGYSAAELTEKRTPYRDIVHPGDLQRVEQAWQQKAAGEVRTQGIDYRIQAADGRTRWVYEYSVPVQSPGSGEITYLNGYILDISERKASEYELVQEKEKAQITLHSIAEAVVTTDINGQIEYLNPRAEELTGWESRMARGLPVVRVFSLFDEISQGLVDEPVSNCLRTGEIQMAGSDIGLVRNDGQRFSMRYSASPIMAVSGAPIGVILIFHDVTGERNLEEQLSYQATHDVLTGLLNRTAFETQLGYAIDYAGKTDDEHVLCFIDIDQLKIINDTGSHEIGDRLLKKMALLLRECLRDSDEIARLGGDEFGALLKNCTLEDATAQAARIIEAVHDLRYCVDDRVFEIGASIGLTQIGRHSTSTTLAMSEADLACQAAKDLGGSRYHVYHSSDEELMRRQDEMRWVARISDAIQSNRFVLYYQPIAPTVQAERNELHFEVLVRMLDERGELVMPDRFLPAAERYNLVSTIDRWVVTHSFDWYASHCLHCESNCIDTMAINLSGVSLTDRGLLQHIRGCMSKYGVPPESVCFEITETAAITNLSAASDFIHDLKKLGVRFALDDFGSGLSSFAYLKNLPVDYLKIDGQFVRDMDTDSVNHAMVSAVQMLGSVIGIKTIAEFVENEHIIDMLSELGVDYVQGYAIARPMPLEELDICDRRTA